MQFFPNELGMQHNREIGKYEDRKAGLGCKHQQTKESVTPTEVIDVERSSYFLFRVKGIDTTARKAEQSQACMKVNYIEGNAGDNFQG